MKLTTAPSKLAGSVRIPGSKSHTVRAVLFATLASAARESGDEGMSLLRDPLVSGDTESALVAASGLGASIHRSDDDRLWRIQGVGSGPLPGGHIDVGNSGTTLYVALAAAALLGLGAPVQDPANAIRFDGDDQIRRRSAANLIGALRDLGARIDDTNGCCPITVHGGLRGGTTTIECPTSQYLSALLIAAPLMEGDVTVIDVPLLHERPYVTMTLDWLEFFGIKLTQTEAMDHFEIPGRQRYRPFERAIPADFSGATFFLCAAAITGSRLLVQGLDMADPQGDKAVVDYLRAMGATIDETAEGLLVHAADPDARGPRLHGAELDLNATPDALPALAVAAALAEGRTLLGNVPQARIKETDRIAVMAAELASLGAVVEERADGLLIHGKGAGSLRGGAVRGHGDHRVVMAMAVAGLGAAGPVTVDTAESAAVTYPTFVESLRALGASVSTTP